MKFDPKSVKKILVSLKFDKKKSLIHTIISYLLSHLAQFCLE